MNGLNQFLRFDLDAFLQGKSLKTIGCRVWKDYNTKAVLGTAVDCLIDKDETVYPRATDKPISNAWERVSIKIAKNITIPGGVHVIPVDATGSVYGPYRNQLSIKAADIRIVDEI